MKASTSARPHATPLGLGALNLALSAPGEEIRSRVAAFLDEQVMPVERELSASVNRPEAHELATALELELRRLADAASPELRMPLLVAAHAAGLISRDDPGPATPATRAWLGTCGPGPTTPTSLRSPPGSGLKSPRALPWPRLATAAIAWPARHKASRSPTRLSKRDLQQLCPTVHPHLLTGDVSGVF